MMAHGFASSGQASGNLFTGKPSPSQLLAFETNAFEVSPVFRRDLENSVSTHSSLKGVESGCGWRMKGKETHFLQLMVTGLHKKDGAIDDSNRSEKLGKCVYGQETFTIDLELDK